MRTHFNFSANFISPAASPSLSFSLSFPRGKKFYLRVLPHFTKHKNANGEIHRCSKPRFAVPSEMLRNKSKKIEKEEGRGKRKEALPDDIVSELN